MQFGVCVFFLIFFRETGLEKKAFLYNFFFERERVPFVFSTLVFFIIIIIFYLKKKSTPCNKNSC